MENDEKAWQNQEQWFNKWSSGNAKTYVNTETTILKSIFFFNREKILKTVSSHYAEKIEFPEVSDIHYSLKDQLFEEPKSAVAAYNRNIRFSIAPSYPHISNERLIQQLKSNDRDLFINLYEYEFPKIYWHIRNNSGSFEQAKDVFQDSLVIVMEKIIQNNFDLTCSFGTYLFSVAKNLWFTQLKRQKSEVISSLANLSEFENEIQIINSDDMPEDYHEIAPAISKLGKGCQKLLNLYYYEQKDWETIASELGYTSAANARNQKYKCLEKIRKMVNDKEKSCFTIHALRQD